jgi:replicative DNA helicase
LSLIRESIKRYDLKFVVFDNIHFLVRSVSNVNEELGQAVQGFKLLAEEMEIPIMAIAQPRKRDLGGRDEIMRAEDIKYSNAVHADCDQMIILYRKRVASKAKEIDGPVFAVKTEALDPVTLVRVEAHRYGAGGETLLYFHGEYSRFDALDSRQAENKR